MFIEMGLAELNQKTDKHCAIILRLEVISYRRAVVFMGTQLPVRTAYDPIALKCSCLQNSDQMRTILVARCLYTKNV